MSTVAALGPYDGLSVGFSLLFTLAVVVVLAVGALLVVSLVRNVRVLRRAGVSPFTLQSQVALRYLRGGPPDSLEGRLAELESMELRGLITSDERASARARLLGTL
ncbi:hypothetical protein CLV35_2652 [Motilibacter peucedani]|uniref:Uncharacterized protein n=1 Tax=Motilibacter peucedani TaxID=598650 RepID=A0A420XLZ2_9ACTN|nr:hypothetical protein [Motilibacter peucedani]RKS72408.1 hypothetical protein CLV35_2652 [Motilibacter peucedani]